MPFSYSSIVSTEIGRVPSTCATFPLAIPYDPAQPNSLQFLFTPDGPILTQGGMMDAGGNYAAQQWYQLSSDGTSLLKGVLGFGGTLPGYAFGSGGLSGGVGGIYGNDASGPTFSPFEILAMIADLGTLPASRPATPMEAITSASTGYNLDAQTVAGLIYNGKPAVVMAADDAVASGQMVLANRPLSGGMFSDKVFDGFDPVTQSFWVMPQIFADVASGRNYWLFFNSLTGSPFIVVTNGSTNNEITRYFVSLSDAFLNGHFQAENYSFQTCGVGFCCAVVLQDGTNAILVLAKDGTSYQIIIPVPLDGNSRIIVSDPTWGQGSPSVYVDAAGKFYAGAGNGIQNLFIMSHPVTAKILPPPRFAFGSECAPCLPVAFGTR